MRGERAAPAELAGRTVDRGGVRELVPAVGLARPMQATEEFLSASAFGLRCVRSPAQELAGQLTTIATNAQARE